MTNDPPEAVLPPPKAGGQANGFGFIWPVYKDLTPGPSPPQERGENNFARFVAINRSSVGSLSLFTPVFFAKALSSRTGAPDSEKKIVETIPA